MRGRIIKSTGSWYQVLSDENLIIKARIKGKIRLKDIKHTNPIAVGDWVDYEMEGDEGNAVIHHIHERQNYIIRKSSNLSKQTHILASNIDYVFIMATVAFPQTSIGFIDRILVTAEAYHIKPILIFNKIDLYNNEQQNRLNELCDLYEHKVGYSCMKVSALTKEGIDRLKDLLKNHTSLIIGHSGVGKTSTLNAIESGLGLKTSSLSSYHQKGQHTTTFAEMYPLSIGGFIIDTPGIREFGVIDIPDNELSHYFKEMKQYIGDCKFSNCLHTHEPNCAIINALNEGKISMIRYQSYLSILANEDVFA